MSRSSSESGGLFAHFLHSEVTGSLVLLACTVTALLWANSPWADGYHHLAHTEIGVWWGEARFGMSLHHWINDALMALFFFVVGLEIKREVAVGELSSPRKAALPVMAAVGGMIAPALLYLAFNPAPPEARGWGIAMATDIAFALGLLSLFGRRVPLGLKVFLTALAIADDIGAVLVIALFYSEGIRWGALAAAGALLAVIALAGRLGIRFAPLYLGLAVGVWAAVLASGVHATVAGILVALLVPVRARIDPERFLTLATSRLAALRRSGLTRSSMLEDRSQLDAITDLHEAAGDLRPAGITLEEALHPVQAFFVLPLFALFNAGVTLNEGTGETLGEPVTLGIVVGLVAGKQLGVTLFSWLAVRLGLADLPAGVRWGQLYGAACLAGVGFTMSLFIGDLAFSDPALEAGAKLGILCASLVAAAIGVGVLARALPPAGHSGAV